MRWLLILAVLVASPAFGQVLRIDGQASDFAGSGGGLTYIMPTFTATFGVAYFENHWLVGAADEFQWRGWDTTLGTKIVGFNFEGGGVGLSATGLTLEKKKPNFSAF